MSGPGWDMEALMEALRDNRECGSGEVALQACAALVRSLAGAEEQDAGAVRATVRWLSERIVAAQPSMGPVRAVAAAAVRAAEASGPTDSAADVGARVVRALEAFQQRLAQAGKDAARHAAGLIRPGARVLTLSRSSSVLRALESAGKAGSLHVVCLESRPLLEGRRLAADLLERGIQATLAADAAAATLVAGCDLFLVGADAVADAGVVNKIGTHATALAAAAAGVACYAVADSSKLLPPGVVPALADERPADEVWADAPAGVHVWNRYFEATPLRLFRAIVLEEGALTPQVLEERRRGLRS